MIMIRLGIIYILQQAKPLSFLAIWTGGLQAVSLLSYEHGAQETVLLLSLCFHGGKGAEEEEEGNKCNLEPVLSLTDAHTLMKWLNLSFTRTPLASTNRIFQTLHWCCFTWNANLHINHSQLQPSLEKSDMHIHIIL
jgi:hypothetical protein